MSTLLVLGSILTNSLVPNLAPAAHAATGEQYLAQATDPHGNVWLPGTVDGTTLGQMDPGTDPTSPSFGHLWTTDVPSGFCRIIPTAVDAVTGAVTPAALDRSTPGGCITAGGKAGQPALDSRRNQDGTFYVYTPDWAVFSNGVYRLTYDPGKQLMTKAELLAPNRYPANNKPFDVQLGPADGKLYVSNDKDGNIARISGVTGPIPLQTVETSIAKSNDGTRVRAITFVCWSNLATLNGGKGAARAAGQAGCNPKDPAPDLVLAQKSTISVVLNAETCGGTCVALPTNVKVLTPMGLRTDPTNPTTFYISDSPGATSQIIRYNIGTDIQDSYANYGNLTDGTLSQFSFAFSVGFDPMGAMFVGDDPSAGATAFNGRYFRIAPKAPADASGQPNAAASPPPPPSATTGSLFGGTVPPVTGTTSGPVTAPTAPSDGVWMGTHLWIPDSLNGLCRMDPSTDPAVAGMAENLSTCMLGANAAGLLKPEQSVFDAGKNLLYVADGGSKSVGVVRFAFDPVAETLSNPQVIASGLVGTGLGVDGQRADAVALDTTVDTLYVGFRARNLGANTQIARVRNASAADTSTQTSVEFIAKTTRTAPVFGLGIVKNADGTRDLYIGDNKGVDLLTNVDACPVGGCIALLLLNVRGPRGFATDGTNHLYLAGPPAPGSASSSTPIQQYTISTGDLFTYSSVGIYPDSSQAPYQFVFSLALDPVGNLYVADYPTAVAPPNGQGHIWKVAPPKGAAQPSISSKPANPTNQTTPSFAFSSLTAASYQCSLVTTGAADSFAPCTSPFTPATALTGNPPTGYTFKVEALDAAGATSAPAIYSFTVDTVAPVVNITQSPTSPSKANAPSFTFTSSKPSTTFSCSLSTGADAFSPCGSPQSYAAQPDGGYIFKVQGTDLAGNASNIASSLLTIDTVAPTITASPAGGSYTAAQSVTLASPVEPAQIFFTLDGTTPTTASTAYSLPINIASTTTLKYIGVDAAGNQSAVSTQVYTIGNVILNKAPSSPSANSTPSFTFSAPAATGATFSCALTTAAPTAADFSACTSPKTYATTANGTYTFTVQGFDSTGAALGSAASSPIVIDAAAPVLTSNPSNPSPSSTETFKFNKAEAAGWSFQCSFGAQGAADAFQACTSPASYASVADGLYCFKVKAVDADGIATPVTQYNFSVNAGATAPTATAPVQSFTVPSGPDSLTAVPVTLTWSGGASAVKYHVQEQINGGAWIDVSDAQGVSLASTTATSAVVNLRPSAVNQATVTTYKFQVAAINSAGVQGAFATQAAFSVPVQDNTTGFSFNGAWSGQNVTGALNGSVQFSSTAGAFAQNSNASTMTGTSVAWVSTVGPDRGTADVWLDGAKVATVDLYASAPATAQVVWKAENLGNVGHTIKIVVTGQKNLSSSGTRVDVDALLALK